MWNPVSQQMPPNTREVLVYVQREVLVYVQTHVELPFMAVAYWNGRQWWLPAGVSASPEDVTHWMPLPAPPQ